MARLVLDDEATFFFLSLVEQFPALWDMSSEDYSRSHLKNSIWQQIGAEMGARYPQFAPYSVEALKVLLQNKRRNFRDEKKKILKTKSGQPASDGYMGKWKFFKALMFLDTVDGNSGKRGLSDDFGGGTEVDGASLLKRPARPGYARQRVSAFGFGVGVELEDIKGRFREYRRLANTGAKTWSSTTRLLYSLRHQKFGRLVCKLCTEGALARRSGLS
ncbi:hypothetical protein HPB47_016716 [Ixodes persulcatus]|uniref:Uncharacterized protein n=1 Tax=Ixodes persulcatus TaxID=34615 RepID=A0AC60QQD4_IXOPE|nr:hypothetical protein HPB47_016716 [Ixodes persulcatus]